MNSTHQFDCSHNRELELKCVAEVGSCEGLLRPGNGILGVYSTIRGIDRLFDSTINRQAPSRASSTPMQTRWSSARSRARACKSSPTVLPQSSSRALQMTAPTTRSSVALGCKTVHSRPCRICYRDQATGRAFPGTCDRVPC